MYLNLLLKPRISSDRIQWVFGENENLFKDSNNFIFSIQTKDYTPFSSFLNCCNEIIKLSNDNSSIIELKNVLIEINEVHEKSSVKNEKGSLEDGMARHKGVVIALRRISREGADISSLIHRAASIFLDTLIHFNYIRYIFPSIDLVDRLSLKVFTRICLLTNPNSTLSWVWIFENSYSSFFSIKKPDQNNIISLWDVGRKDLFITIKSVLNPKIINNNKLSNNERINLFSKDLTKISIATASSWLTYLCYDTCFLWDYNKRNFSYKTKEDIVDIKRLIAIASMNIGQYRSSIQYLKEAYSITQSPTLKAHISYMMGLIYAKRFLDLENSFKCYEQGLNALSNPQINDLGDANVEKAWIYNGIALNTLIATRLKSQNIKSIFKKTYNLILEAFELIKDRKTPDRMYLRYNLLANMANFMRIQGNYEIALKLIEDTTESLLEADLIDEQVWKAITNSRKASIYAKMGELKTSEKLFCSSYNLISKSNCVLRKEIVGRSIGTLNLRMNNWNKAIDIFNQGFKESIKLRTRKGTVYNANGLIIALLKIGENNKAIKIYEELIGEEDIWLAGRDISTKNGIKQLTLSKKLPEISLSLPEIDLEDTGPVSISSVLRGDTRELNKIPNNKSQLSYE